MASNHIRNMKKLRNILYIIHLVEDMLVKMEYECDNPYKKYVIKEVTEEKEGKDERERVQEWIDKERKKEENENKKQD
ncbi:hypothetical protein CHS0354_024365 [Potamilus streckersoni]|uniref:Uncharacterized protein n=1 Tax=Potamilus streckersoni TaxID=2493646 RepID=A0AAE0SW67_9BIVA|nr:hypothetical protein CHS0354_024365 [Potamilus streckersoni]